MSRHDKVAEAIRQEASIIIHDELTDPRLGFVTITKVELTDDLRYAKIFFSVLGSEEAHVKTKEALGSALGFVRRLLAQRLNLRFAPEIAFSEDRAIEYSVRIEEVLNQIKESDKILPSPEKKSRTAKKRKEKKSEPKKNRRGRKKA